MYEFRLGDLLLPVTPENVQVKIKNQNSTVTLINNSEFNFIKPPGLTEVTFDALIPAFKYPFARYDRGFQNQKYFLDAFEKLKTDNLPFSFIVSRTLPDGTGLYDTDLWVSLEGYEIKEEAKNGFDITVSITLKQYVESQTEYLIIRDDGTAVIEKQRETQNAPLPKKEESYTVKKGDTLWAIAKYYYGDGSKYTSIAKANPSIVNPNLIYPGQTLVIPKT